jgi:hypothetical protein
VKEEVTSEIKSAAAAAVTEKNFLSIFILLLIRFNRIFNENKFTM